MLTAKVLSKHNHCERCAKSMPQARFGQRYCSARCRADGRAEEQRAAQLVWRAAGRPSEDEVMAMGEAAQ
jgi:predicted nucleic acid-binding Zn ribbon protein